MCTAVLHGKTPELEETDVVVCKAEGAYLGGGLDVGPGRACRVVAGRRHASERRRQRRIALRHDAGQAIEKRLLAVMEGGHRPNHVDHLPLSQSVTPLFQCPKSTPSSPPSQSQSQSQSQSHSLPEKSPLAPPLHKNSPGKPRLPGLSRCSNSGTLVEPTPVRIPLFLSSTNSFDHASRTQNRRGLECLQGRRARHNCPRRR